MLVLYYHTSRDFAGLNVHMGIICQFVILSCSITFIPRLGRKNRLIYQNYPRMGLGAYENLLKNRPLPVFVKTALVKMAKTTNRVSFVY